MKDTGHIETCPYDELVARHRQVELMLIDAAVGDLGDDAPVRKLAEADRRYRAERVRRAAVRRS